MAHGDVNYFELPVDDEDRARSFCSGLFGWDTQSRTDRRPYMIGIWERAAG